MNGYEFYSTLRSMLNLVNDELLTDKFPVGASHNVGARILRHGLAVSAFSLLEKYLEGIFSNVMNSVSRSSIQFELLPQSLQRFIIVDAVSGLSNKLRTVERGDHQAFVEKNLLEIAAFDRVPASYTALGFSPVGSNVNQEDIKNAFLALGVKSPWQKLSRIASEIGSSRLDLAGDYKNLAKTRHSSAHNPAGNVATSDLVTHIESAILLGIAVAVLARAVADVYGGANTTPRLEAALASLSWKYRFIDEESDKRWVERLSTGGKVIRRYSSEQEAVGRAKLRIEPNMIICRNQQQIPVAME